MKARAHVVVSGRVQGVFFRARTKREAASRNVKGWILNRDDGALEAVFEGEEEAVKAMVAFCKHGPSEARVTNVDVVWEDYVGEFEAFEIRY
jgi:acylphosphatase